MTKFLAVVGGLLLVVCLGLGYALRQAYQDMGAAELALDSANKVIAQKEADHVLSQKLYANLQGRLEATEAQVQPIRERIVTLPATTVCVKSDVMRSVAVGMRAAACAGSGSADPRCGPAGAVQARSADPARR